MKLHQLPMAFDLPVSVSQFCAKLECYLRLTGRPHTIADGTPRESPTKTVPYVTFEGGERVGDTHAIIPRLEAEGPALDGHLDDGARARGEALTTLAEGDLYTAVLFHRFVDPAGWKHQKPVVAAMLPWLLRPVLIPVIRGGAEKRARERGADDAATVYRKGIAVIDQLAEELGDGSYFLGDSPHVVDCAVWGQLLHAWWTPWDNELRRAVEAHPALPAFVERLAERAELAIPDPPAV